MTGVFAIMAIHHFTALRSVFENCFSQVFFVDYKIYISPHLKWKVRKNLIPSNIFLLNLCLLPYISKLPLFWLFFCFVLLFLFFYFFTSQWQLQANVLAETLIKSLFLRASKLSWQFWFLVIELSTFWSVASFSAVQIG